MSTVSAIDDNDAAILAVVAVEDLDQRRFAGAIFAHQGQHLAWIQVQGDVVQHFDAKETLGDIAAFPG